MCVQVVTTRCCSDLQCHCYISWVIWTKYLFPQCVLNQKTTLGGDLRTHGDTFLSDHKCTSFHPTPLWYTDRHKSPSLLPGHLSPPGQKHCQWTHLYNLTSPVLWIMWIPCPKYPPFFLIFCLNFQDSFSVLLLCFSFKHLYSCLYVTHPCVFSSTLSVISPFPQFSSADHNVASGCICQKQYLAQQKNLRKQECSSYSLDGDLSLFLY